MRPQWDTPIRYLVLIFLLILFIAALWYVREIFQPLIAAGLIAYFLSPAVNFVVVHFRLRRKTSANLVYFLSLAVVIGLLVSAVPLLFDELQSVTEDLTVALNEMETALQKPVMIGNLPFQFGTLIPAIRQTISGVAIPNPQDALRIIQVTSRNFLWFLVIVVTAYYLMTDWDRLRTNLINLAPRSEQDDLNRLYREIRAVWLGYLRGQIRLMFILAIMYSIAWFAIGTLSLYLVLNNFKTIWLQPRILGQSVFLHEGVVFVAIIAAIVLQGVLGVLIIVPLLATFVVLGRYIRRRLLGMPPFADEEPALSLDHQPAAPIVTESEPQQIAVQEEKQK